MTEHSTVLEDSHLFSNSQGAKLHDLTIYNDTAGTLYAHLVDTNQDNAPATITTEAGIGAGAVDETNHTFEPSADSCSTGMPVRLTGTTIFPECAKNATCFVVRISATAYGLAPSLELANRCAIELALDPTLTTFTHLIPIMRSTNQVTVNIGNWPEFAPIQLPTKSSAIYSFDPPKSFGYGILGALSSSATALVAVASAGKFTANYSTK